VTFAAQLVAERISMPGRDLVSIGHRLPWRPPEIGRVAVASTSVEDTGEALTGKARFERFVVPEIDVMLRVARSITPNAAEAEDVVQDALLRAYRSIDGFDGKHPRAWLLTIVRNANINRNRRQRPSLLTDPDAPEQQGQAPTSHSTEDVYLDGTFDAAVAGALAALSPDARQVVELVDLAGLSYAEAAEVLGVPVGTVMSRLHRARQRMREDLRRRGVTAGGSS
jgi:RNA polymerase sigma-70 factor (ECF subfamily)